MQKIVSTSPAALVSLSGDCIPWQTAGLFRGPVAQPVEHETLNLGVVGANPTRLFMRHPITDAPAPSPSHGAAAVFNPSIKGGRLCNASD